VTQLELALARALGTQTGLDVEAIINAAQASAGDKAPDAPKAERKKAAAAPTAPETPQPLKPDAPAEPPKPVPPPGAQPAPEPQKDAAPAGVDLTGLFTGSGAEKKVVKAVFLAAVEKANGLAALVALNGACDCGIDASPDTAETAPLLKKKMLRWGNAQE
jgi:pyruvate/2-oxoglutarate dehydrogenase complex dihydrolipoamide acyltransferase (E2) component